MPDYDLCFSTSATDDAGSFKLLELPPELTQLVDAATKNSAPLALTIKGQVNEDAVLCTNDKTYALRSVALSNSVLVVTPSAHDFSLSNVSGREAVAIRDELHEILELIPTVPRLYKLAGLLRGREYDESDESHSHLTDQTMGFYSYQDARNEIQASDAELDRGLKERRILVIRGSLRSISKDYLQNLLEIVLNLLVSLAFPYDNVPLDDLVSSLAEEHEVPRTISIQLLAWFGEVDESERKWKMDVEAVLREVGMGLLRHHRRDPISKEAFMSKWKAAVGDAFENLIDIKLLSGNCLVSTSNDTDHLTFFPSSELPKDPAQRFADLFLTRTRWKGDDIAPFLGGIAVNSKDRDRLLLKYCRASTDTQGVWYTSRTQYNG
ncbi:putative sister chromatid cohesion protein DCC1 [Leucoagaricus sp. SymC.cos]|nr:putative sister chromatid cohesion protein DCC1 [Leucoagaricus sp. SymC.cos]